MNQQLIANQRAQSNILRIHLENEWKKQNIRDHVKINIDKIKKRQEIKTQEDFIKESNQVFDNFGNK